MSKLASNFKRVSPELLFSTPPSFSTAQRVEPLKHPSILEYGKQSAKCAID